MTAMFAMVAANHHALIEMFNEASQFASVRLLWQNPNCLVGHYNKHGPVQNRGLHQFSFTHANTIVASSHAPDNEKLRAQINEDATSLSRIIKGAHSAFCWVDADGHLVASRDALNQHCLYYARVGQVTVISSEASFIAGLLPSSPSLNPAALACWLAGEPNPELCLYNNIDVLPLGCAMQADVNGGISIHSFWDIDPHYRLDLASDNAYRDAFSQLLTETVGDHIAADDNVVVSQMSGGMDSTSITALAHRMLGPERICRPLSHLYNHSQSCDESDNIKAMYSHLGLRDPIQITVDAGAHRDFLSLYPTDFDSPGTVLSPRYHQECEIIQAAGSHRLLTGNGGDEMCWGHASAYTQRLKHGELNVVNEVLKACKKTGMAPWPVLRSLFVKPMIPESLMALARKIKGRQPADLPNWLSSKASKLAQEAGTVANPFNQKKDEVGYARYQALKTTSTFNSLRSYQKVAWQYGIEVVHPFFDPRIAEFSFAIPPKQLIRGAYPKWLLRNAMDNVLPDSVCWNVQKVTFDNHFGQLVKDNAAPLRKLLEDTRLEDMGLLNNTKLLDAFDHTVNSTKAHVHVDLLYAILTQRWIQQHH
jgi:asparagine synthase (glutamine-hydrolysing)